MGAPAHIPLPPSLRRIADAIGVDEALRLAQELGGRNVSVSTRDTNAVCRLIGSAAAARLLDLIRAGEIGDGVRHLDVPRVPAAQHGVIRAAVAAGLSKQEAAARFGLTARQVRRICNEVREQDDRQGRLFE